jgi:hypothetical protein
LPDRAGKLTDGIFRRCPRRHADVLRSRSGRWRSTETSIFFSVKRWAYSDMPSCLSQSAICCIAASLPVDLSLPEGAFGPGRQKVTWYAAEPNRPSSCPRRGSARPYGEIRALGKIKRGLFATMQQRKGAILPVDAIHSTAYRATSERVKCKEEIKFKGRIK